MARQYIVVTILSLVVGFAAGATDAEMITFETNSGTFVVETFDDTPVAVNNFKQYIEQGLLIDSFIHLAGNIPLQGGGNGSILWGGQNTIDIDTSTIGSVSTLPPVSAPSQATHSNLKYTITMAQTEAPGLQYTSGWFINMTDNTQLDGQQFTAWGEVVQGRDVLDAILAFPTTNLGAGLTLVPVDDVNNDNIATADELVRLTAITIPEPSSLAVLMLGGLAMLRRRAV